MNFRLDELKRDIDKGMYFDSSIPQGYGVGSSGALVAAVYDKYANDKITILETGCPDVVIEGEKLQQYTGMPLNNPTIVAYLSQLDDMYDDCVAIDAKEWIDFIVQYTFPSLTINYGKNTLSDDEEALAECIAQALADYGATITNRALDELFTLPDKIADRMNKYMCEERSEQTFSETISTTQQLINRLYEQQNTKLYKNIAEQEEKFLKSSIYTIPQDFILRMKKIKSTKGKANLVDLYNSIIDDYGFCGFLALIQAILSCINQNFSFEELLKKLVEASLKGFTPLQMIKFLELLPSDKRVEVITKVDAVLKQNDIFNQFLGTFADPSNAVETVSKQIYELKF